MSFSSLRSGHQSRVLRGTLSLVSGSVAAKIIGMGALPILTRLFSPEDFGVLSVFNAFILLLIPIITLRYSMALPLPKSDGFAVNLAAANLLVIALTTSLLIIFLMLFAERVFPLFSVGVVLPYWPIVPMAAMIYALAGVLKLWMTRKRKYNLISTAEVGQSLAGSLVKIGFGLLGFQPMGLLIGQTVAQSSGAILMIREFKSDFQRLYYHVSLGRMRLALYVFRDFVFFRTPAMFISTISMQLPVFVFSAIYGTAGLGQFSLAMMAITMPIHLIGANAGKAFLGEASAIHRKSWDQLRRTFLGTMALLAVPGGVIAVFLFVFSPLVFALVFGAQWAEAGHYASIMAFLFFFRLVTVPVMHALAVLRQERLFLQIEIQRLGLGATGLLVGYLLGSGMADMVFGYVVFISMHHITSAFRVYRVFVRGRHA